MANNLIQIKRTSVSGRAANTTTLPNAGELALNMADGILYSGNGSAVFEIGANTTNSRVTNNLTVGGTVTATGIVSGSELTSTLASGDEGGQINLAKPPNATTAGGVTIDAYQNRVRIFEQGGNARGVYIDLTACANGVGTNLLTGGSGGTGTVTSVGSGNGLTGGPITGSGTLSVLANNGIIANSTGVFVNGNTGLVVNATGVHVNSSYIQNTDTRTLSGNLIFSGANVVFSGGARFSGGVVANGSLGTAGQILASNGTSVYWTSDQGANAITANTLTANFISVSTGTITVGNSTVNTDIGNNYVSVGNSTSFANMYSTFIRIGNSTVTSTINSSSFTGTANNATNLGGVAAASYLQNTDSRTLSGNLTFTGSSTFNGNITIATTAALFANGNSGSAGQVLSSNGSTVYWSSLPTYVQNTDTRTLSGDLTFTGSSTFNGNVTIGTSARLFANGNSGSAGQVLTSNGSTVYWSTLPTAFSSATSYTWTNTQTFNANIVIGTTAALFANGNSGSAGQVLTSNGSTVYWSTLSGVNTAAAYTWTNTNNFEANVTFGSSSPTKNVDINMYVLKLRVYSNNAGSGGIYSSYGLELGAGPITLNETAGSNGQVITSNGTVASWQSLPAAVVNVGAQYTWTNTQTFSNTITFSQTINGTANNANNLGGVAAASYIQNTDSRTLSGNLNFTGANLTISSNLTIASTGELIITAGAGIYANGSLGTANQVLTSNGTSVYWSTVSGGGSFDANASYVWSNTQTFNGNVSFTAANVYFSGGLFGSVKPRVSSASSITSPLAWNSDNYDTYIITAQAEALTINADSGAPVNGQKIVFRIKDNGTARALTWTTGTSKSFRAVGILLPTTTVISKTLYVGAIYNSDDSRWDVIATAQEA